MDYNNFDWDTEIIRVVRMLQRHYTRVYPWMLTPQFDLIRVEGSFRRDMSRLAREGRLIRVGGEGSRRGYRVPTCAKVTLKPVQFATWQAAS